MNILVVVIAFIFLLPHRGTAEDGRKFELNHDAIAGGLMIVLHDTLDIRELSVQMRKENANQLYALLFQYWLSKHKMGLPTKLAHKTLQRFAMDCGVYTNKRDPLGIEVYYEEGVLTDLGKGRLALAPLNDASELFLKRSNYLALVDEFILWLML